MCTGYVWNINEFCLQILDPSPSYLIHCVYTKSLKNGKKVKIEAFLVPAFWIRDVQPVIRHFYWKQTDERERQKGRGGRRKRRGMERKEEKQWGESFRDVVIGRCSGVSVVHTQLPRHSSSKFVKMASRFAYVFEDTLGKCEHFKCSCYILLWMHLNFSGGVLKLLKWPPGDGSLEQCLRTEVSPMGFSKGSH